MLTEAKRGAETEVVRLLGRIVPGLGEARVSARSLLATADGLTVRVLLGDLGALEAESTLRTELEQLGAAREK